MNLSALLKENRKYRVHKIPSIEGLIKLDDMAAPIYTENDIGGSLIIPKDHITIYNPSSVINTQELYNNCMNTSYPLIGQILNNINGVVLCGGAALWGYMGKLDTAPKDFDLFLYNNQDLSDEEKIEFYNEKVKVIIDIIRSLYVDNYKIYIVKGVITINIPIIDTQVQIILKDYFSISEILHSFDLFSCCIAWDGKTTYFTKMAEWSLTYRINIILPEYRSRTYESRLIKYFNKGFAILFPFLNLKNSIIISDEKTIHLPNLSITLYHTENNIAIGDISLPELDLLHSIYTTKDMEFFDIDYDKITNSYIIDITKNDIYFYQIFQKNCHKFIKNKKTFELLLYLHKNENILDKNIIKLPISRILSYNSYKNWLYEYIEQNIIIKQDEFILNENFIKELIHNYEEFAKTNNIQKIKIQLDKINQRIMDIKIEYKKIFILRELIKNICDYMLALYNSQKDEIISYIQYIDRSINLTSSIYPIIQTNKEWYGSYYYSFAKENPQKRQKKKQRKEKKQKKAQEEKRKVQEEKSTQICILEKNFQFNEIVPFIKEHIKSLESENNICPLCCEPINYLNPMVITLRCGHIYHYHKKNNCECEGIDRWLLIKNECPECRLHFPKKENKF